MLFTNYRGDSHLCQEVQADLEARQSQEHPRGQAHPILLERLGNPVDQGGREGRKYLVDQQVQLELAGKRRDPVRDPSLHHLGLAEVVARMESRRGVSQEDRDCQELPIERDVYNCIDFFTS